MNRTGYQITATLALALAAAGCHKGGKLDKASHFTPPAGPVELKLKWPLGEHLVQETDTKQAMEMTVPNQPAPIKQNLSMTQKSGLTVLQQTPDGGREIEMEFLSSTMQMEMGGRSMISYDSSKTPTPDKGDPVGAIFGKMIGAKLQFYLDSSNHVDRVAGVDEFRARFAGDGRPNPAAQAIKGMFNEGYFKQMMNTVQFMPPKAVQPGDTWPVLQEIPMAQMGTMELNYTVTFARWEMHGKRNCARLEFQGDVSTKPGESPNPMGMTISIKDGAMSGISWFDPEIGNVIDTTMNQNMPMVMTMAMRGHPMSMTNRLNQNIEMKLDTVE